jgi:uncharacterized protein
MPERKLAIVTGASTGIGLELARECAKHKHHFDLLIAANEPQINEAADELRREGGSVEAVEADLATLDGVDALCEKIGTKRVDALLANAGRGLGKAFLDQYFDAARYVLDTNVTGTIYLFHKVGRMMRARGAPARQRDDRSLLRECDELVDLTRRQLELPLRKDAGGIGEIADGACMRDLF